MKETKKAWPLVACKQVSKSHDMTKDGNCLRKKGRKKKKKKSCEEGLRGLGSEGWLTVKPHKKGYLGRLKGCKGVHPNGPRGNSKFNILRN